MAGITGGCCRNEESDSEICVTRVACCFQNSFLLALCWRRTNSELSISKFESDSPAEFFDHGAAHDSSCLVSEAEIGIELSTIR